MALQVHVLLVVGVAEFVVGHCAGMRMYRQVRKAKRLSWLETVVYPPIVWREYLRLTEETAGQSGPLLRIHLWGMGVFAAVCGVLLLLVVLWPDRFPV